MNTSLQNAVTVTMVRGDPMFDFRQGLPSFLGVRMAPRCGMDALYTLSGPPQLIILSSACQVAHRLLTSRPTASRPLPGRCKVVASMHSRAPPIVGRARRLTDTVGDDTIAAAKARAAGSLGGAHGGIPAGVAAGHDDVVNVVTCLGGGLETSRSCVAGSHRVTYSVHTAPGADPGGRTKDNQDAWAVKERLGGGEVMMLGVFDGHGAEGKVVSNFLATTLHKILARSPHCKPASLETCCMTSFPEANRSLRRTPGVDVTLSGSTAVVALLSGGRLQVANLGDSRAVLGALESKGGVRAIPLSADHTPMDPQEAARINASGGRIASFMYNDAPLGPPRVWLRDVNVPGLCMTRSFGDSVAASVGVSDTPEVVSHVLKPEDRYLVLMSDGIFEFMDSQEVLDMVHGVIAKEGGSPADAAKKLVKEARARWQEEEEDIIDDCTALVAVLTPAAASTNPAAPGAPAAMAVAPQSSAQRLISNMAGRLESSLRLGGGAASGGNSSSNSNSSGSSGKPNTVSKPAGPGTLGYKRL